MGTAKAVNRRCIFCSNPANSGEHIWPKWMRDFLKRPGHIKRIETAHNYSKVAAPFGEVVQRTSNGATHERKVYVVCGPCNNGWMNRYHEIPNRKLLEPMLRGSDLSLDADAQHSLARWVALKTLVIEQDPDAGQPPTPIFTRRQTLNFRRTGAIPDSFRIWLAARGGDVWHDSLSQASGRFVLTPQPGTVDPDFVPAGRRRNAQAVTLGAGHLLIHALAVTYPYLDRRLVWEGPSGGIQIWPLPGGTIQWPPSTYLLDWACEAVGRQFGTFARATPRRPPSKRD